MFDNQFDSLYDGSKICISEYAAVKSCQMALETFLFQKNIEMWLQRKRKIDCSVDSDNHL